MCFNRYKHYAQLSQTQLLIFFVLIDSLVITYPELLFWVDFTGDSVPPGTWMLAPFGKLQSYFKHAFWLFFLSFLLQQLIGVECCPWLYPILLWRLSSFLLFDWIISNVLFPSLHWFFFCLIKQLSIAPASVRLYFYLYHFYYFNFSKQISHFCCVFPSFLNFLL